MCCGGGHLELLIDKKIDLFTWPYMEHSCEGTIPSYVRFWRRILKLKSIRQHNWL